MNNKLYILGCGGHARSVADIAFYKFNTDIVFVDKNVSDGEKILGFDTLKLFFEDIEGFGIASSGNNLEREEQTQKILNCKSLELISIISISASIGINSSINLGTSVGHHVHIGPNAKIGLGCILNTASVIEHDSSVGDFSHISVGTKICGNSNIGNNCLIGAGATVINNISISDNVIIGAGSVVVKNITEPGIYIGIPAKKYQLEA